MFLHQLFHVFKCDAHLVDIVLLLKVVTSLLEDLRPLEKREIANNILGEIHHFMKITSFFSLSLPDLTTLQMISHELPSVRLSKMNEEFEKNEHSLFHFAFTSSERCTAECISKFYS